MASRDDERPLTVDIVSDVVCPWCYIGRQRLDAAIGEWTRGQGSPIAIRWHPFELNPDLPAEGMSRAAYVERKFGDRAPAVYDRVGRVGLEVGIRFAFHRIERQPNTRSAHALIAAAGPHGVQDAVAIALFGAYFLDGRDLTDPGVLVEVVGRAGLAEPAAQRALTDPELFERIDAAEAHARSLGITGVPFFIVGGRVGVSGAQEPSVLLTAFRRATSEAVSTPQ